MLSHRSIAYTLDGLWTFDYDEERLEKLGADYDVLLLPKECEETEIFEIIKKRLSPLHHHE